MGKEELIKHVEELYEAHKSDSKIAGELGVMYKVKNLTFYIDIDDTQYTLTRNDLSDLPDGVGDEKAFQISHWAQKVS